MQAGCGFSFLCFLYPNLRVFQIIFSAANAAEMSALPKGLQLELLAEFRLISE